MCKTDTRYYYSPTKIGLKDFWENFLRISFNDVITTYFNLSIYSEKSSYKKNSWCWIPFPRGCKLLRNQSLDFENIWILGEDAVKIWKWYQSLWPGNFQVCGTWSEPGNSTENVDANQWWTALTTPLANWIWSVAILWACDWGWRLEMFIFLSKWA